MSKVIQNRLNAIMVLAGGSIRLQPRGTPGSSATVSDDIAKLPDVKACEQRGRIIVRDEEAALPETPAVAPAPPPAAPVVLPVEEPAPPQPELPPPSPPLEAPVEETAAAEATPAPVPDAADETNTPRKKKRHKG